MVNTGKQAARTRLGVDARREKLLELGRTLFSTYTYDDLSIDDIAREAGISKGLLYHYFPTKRHFYIATIRAGADELLALMAESQPTDPIHRLTHGLDAYLKYVEANANAYVALLRGGVGVDPEVSKIVEGVRTTILDQLMDGMSMRTGSAPPRLRMALYGWIGCAEAVSLDWLEHRDVTLEQVREFLIFQLGAVLKSTTGGLLAKLLQAKMRPKKISKRKEKKE